MCRAGRFLASFSAGTTERPDVLDVVEPSLTLTADGAWVVWAHKLARPRGDGFVPLTGGDPYPRDAVARCRRGGNHHAPELNCTCGFHALSVPFPGFGWHPRLDVALSGRILAFEWGSGGVLFRAERQTVIRVQPREPERLLPPADPAGWLAHRQATHPRGAGPVRLRLPRTAPPVVRLDDDAGYCTLDPGLEARRSGAVLVSAS